MEAGLVDAGQDLLPEAMVVHGFVFGGWDVAAGCVQPAVVVEVDPLQGQLEVVDALPGALVVD